MTNIAGPQISSAIWISAGFSLIRNFPGVANTLRRAFEGRTVDSSNLTCIKKWTILTAMDNRCH
jgi:hypothetical protein